MAVACDILLLRLVICVSCGWRANCVVGFMLVIAALIGYCGFPGLGCLLIALVNSVGLLVLYVIVYCWFGLVAWCLVVSCLGCDLLFCYLIV